MTDSDAAQPVDPGAGPDRSSRSGPTIRSGPIIGRSITDRLSRPPAQAGPVRLRGRVIAGVERGAVVLVDGRGAVLAQLIGYRAVSDPDTGEIGHGVIDNGVIDNGMIDTEVIVTGVYQVDVLTTAQQGRPFRVESVELL